jgi:hypothetical protein
MATMPTPSEKPKLFLPQEQWHVLLDAYRREPGNHTAAARTAACDRKTARKLWEHGDARNPWSARPIREVLLGERQAASARAAAAAAMAAAPATSDEVRRSREAAIEIMAEEAKLLRYARTNAQALLDLTTILSATAIKLAKRVEVTLESEEFLKGMTLAQALLTLNRVAGIVQKGIYVAQSVTGLERDVFGPPEERAGRGAPGKRKITNEEALESLARAANTANLLKERGMRILQGGKAGGPTLVVGETGTDPRVGADTLVHGADTNGVAKGEAIEPDDTPAGGPYEPNGLDAEPEEAEDEPAESEPPPPWGRNGEG